MSLYKIQVFNIIGSPYAVESQDGESVYSSIIKSFDNHDTVSLSFLNIELATTAFLNTAIGKLYEKFDSKTISQRLLIIDADVTTIEQINKVKESAEVFYKDPQWLEDSIKSIIEGKE